MLSDLDHQGPEHRLFRKLMQERLADKGIGAGDIRRLKASAFSWTLLLAARDALCFPEEAPAAPSPSERPDDG